MMNPASFTDSEWHPGKMLSHNLEHNILSIKAEDNLVFKVYVISDDIIRFRYIVDGNNDGEFSYAIDDLSQFEVNHLALEDQLDRLLLKTSSVIIGIYKEDLRIKIMDHDGVVISEDEKGFHWEKNLEHGGQIVQMSKHLMPNEAFYGLGDKPTELNLRGSRFTNWGTDEYGYHKDTDPLYKSIPIYYGLHNGIAYGMFFDNTFRAYFDFGKERDTVTSFWAQGGEMNYYFIAGPSLMDACERYTLLTGTPDLPPMWSLGFQQCKWSYYPESNVKEVTSKMRELKIPCDAIYLDIDYMDGFRCFTWDKTRFPDPKRMIAELKEDGFKTMVIIDPGIKKDMDYDVFVDGLEKDVYCRHADGPYVEGKVWPGDCYFPDFTRPDVREWWADLYKGLIEDNDVAGVWNDMNEPALFEVETKTFPLTVMHDYDGHPTSHRKAHNIYGMQMARATAEGVKKYRNGQRTLIITRSGYSGLQRYSSVWTGDNIATFEHLWVADVQAQRLAISGISFCGSDIGGFINQPTPELMVRWIQLGIFHPFCRVHSSGDHGDQEPWSFGDECTDLFRKFVEIRYQLLPYIYTSFYQYHKFGTPMLRPIVFFDQSDSNTINKDHEFLCGDHILVSPVAKANAKTTPVYLPKSEWYDYWNHKLYTGGQEYKIETPLEQIPIFIKAGAVIPTYPVMQYVGEKAIEAVKLGIYYKQGSEVSWYYEDDQNTFDYEKSSRYSKFETNGDGSSLSISQSIEGDYQVPYASYTLDLIGLPFDPKKVIVDGKEMEWKTEIKVPCNFKLIKIT